MRRNSRVGSRDVVSHSMGIEPGLVVKQTLQKEENVLQIKYEIVKPIYVNLYREKYSYFGYINVL